MIIEALVGAAVYPQIEERLAPAFRGTIVATYSDGRSTELWLDPQGTYRAINRRKAPSSGKWSLKGDKVCLKQQKPFWVPFAYCTPVPSSTSWSAKAAVTGETVQVRLVEDGRKDRGRRRLNTPPSAE